MEKHRQAGINFTSHCMLLEACSDFDGDKNKHFYAVRFYISDACRDILADDTDDWEPDEHALLKAKISDLIWHYAHRGERSVNEVMSDIGAKLNQLETEHRLALR